MKPSAINHKRTDIDANRNSDADTEQNREERTDQQQFQLLVEALMHRTGQPRTEVEQWVNGASKMLRGSVTFYDVSRSIGSFLANRARRAKPYMLSFGRSLLQGFAEEQRLLQAARLQALDDGSTPPGKSAARNKHPKLRAGKAQKRGSAAEFRRARPQYNPWACPSALKQESIMILSQR